MDETPHFSHKVDADRHRLVATFSGVVSLQEIAAHVEARARAGAASYDQLADLSDARLALTTKEVEKMAALCHVETERRVKIAVLVRDDLSFGMARMYGSFMDPTNAVGVFRDRKEALEWLGWG